ncbi:hypothetical protein Pan97_03160 [Bremerella volcania]|uniref:Uncharacterized protein n=1 Tax=Bremerella volcania TaxID=2527984 RepID=A0A518C288_9BACT|nr:hypothetical protein Pan97_03160 [Bremerella volcania]
MTGIRSWLTTSFNFPLRRGALGPRSVISVLKSILTLRHLAVNEVAQP